MPLIRLHGTNLNHSQQLHYLGVSIRGGDRRTGQLLFIKCVKRLFKFVRVTRTSGAHSDPSVSKTTHLSLQPAIWFYVA